MEKRIDPLGALGTGWWMVPVVLTAALGSVAFLTSSDAPPVYRATATLAAAPHPSINDRNQILRSLELLERRTMVSTLSKIPTSGKIRTWAAGRLETPLRDLREYRVHTSVVPNTNLIHVSVQGPDPQIAARFANAVAGVSENNAGTYYDVFTLKVLDDAGVPGRSIQRDETRSYVVAGLLGLFLGVGAAYGVGSLRLTRRTGPTPRANPSRAHAETSS
jgi:capsular polysaccharide biosynthesis protein